MKELFEVSFSGINLIPTIMLLFMFMYWLVVIAGLVDMGALDFDVDLDLDVDVDVDAGGVDADVSVAWLNQLLAFFNLQHIPFMVWFSFLTLPLWGITIFTTYELGMMGWLSGLLVFVPAFIISLILAKFLTWPLIKVFKALDEDAPKDSIGSVGVSISQLEENKKGQVKIETQGAPILVMAKAMPNTLVAKGESVLVIDYLKEENLYLVEPYHH